MYISSLGCFEIVTPADEVVTLRGDRNNRAAIRTMFDSLINSPFDYAVFSGRVTQGILVELEVRLDIEI